MATIGVNVRLLLADRLEGIGRFTHEVFRRLVKLHPEHTFHFYFDRPWDASFIYHENIIPHSVFPQARHPWLYKIWFDYALPYRFKKDNIDLFISPDGYLSLKTEVPQLQIVHDLVFEHFPWMLKKRDAAYYRNNFPKFCEKASGILAVSEYTRQDIVQRYAIPEQKIGVTCNGVSNVFKPISKAAQIEVRKRYTNGRSYWFFYGAIHPRKNLMNQLKAFDLFKANTGANDVFVLAGRMAWLTDDLQLMMKTMRYAKDVLFVTRPSEESLAELVAAARAVMYVSLFEGFGIPILEAMACEVPVITSFTSSMPEVAGDAALFSSPEDIPEIALQMERLHRDETLRKNLVTLGKNRVEMYTWDKAADAVGSALQRLLS